jgi:hypothetical protein
MANKVCDNACLRALLPMETWKKIVTALNETLRNEIRLFVAAYKRITSGHYGIEPYHQWRYPRFPTPQFPFFRQLVPYFELDTRKKKEKSPLF